MDENAQSSGCQECRQMADCNVEPVHKRSPLVTLEKQYLPQPKCADLDDTYALNGLKISIYCYYVSDLLTLYIAGIILRAWTRQAFSRRLKEPG